MSEFICEPLRFCRLTVDIVEHPRRSPCSTLVNSEIFGIKADGTDVASELTTTPGIGVETWPQWGW